MKGRDWLYVLGVVTVSALLLANLLRPTEPQAFNLQESGRADVAVSAVGESAWVVVGTRVYFVSLKSKGDFPDRIIRVIDDEDLPYGTP